MPRWIARFLSIAVGISGSHLQAQQASPHPRSQQRVVAGWIERVSLPDYALSFEAKLDTGADTSSINARSIERFTRNGKTHVRFGLTDDAGRSRQIETPVVRFARIKRSGGDSDRRAVVRLVVCLAGETSEAEFTVTDRSDLNYQILIGRNVLAGRVLIDAAAERIVSDRCSPR